MGRLPSSEQTPRHSIVQKNKNKTAKTTSVHVVVCTVLGMYLTSPYI